MIHSLDLSLVAGANIFLSSNGSIKLGDFGLSVQLQNFKNTNAKEIEKIAGTIRKSTSHSLHFSASWRMLHLSVKFYG